MFRRDTQARRGVWIGGAAALSVLLIILSAAGLLAPLEDLVAVPLNWVSGLFNRAALGTVEAVEGGRSYAELQQYAAELETALAGLTAEVVTLREIESDYDRLAELAGYDAPGRNQEIVTADVVSRDTSSTLRTIVINKGTRDGIRRGMAVITGQGLVGRVIEVTANASRVMLITSEASAVAARVLRSRTEGAVVGRASGELRMVMLDPSADIQIGDLVITSGLGGSLPPDLVIGQVRSTRQFESEIEQSAEISSLIDFTKLEIVQVITSFEPIDLSIFEQSDTADGGQ
jgi:rod shape-determining protein MreC